MPPIYFLLLFPLFIPVLLLWALSRFTVENLKLAGIATAIGTILCWLIILAFSSYTRSDTEILNGFVTSKEINRFTCPVNTWNPCENGYDCNCHTVAVSCTDSNGKSSTCYETECDRCYKYPWEQNFYIDTSLDGDRAHKVPRVDRQGAVTPPRWAKTHRGDPVAKTHSYTNYLLGVYDSVFTEDGKSEEKYKTILPKYPLEIYDFYRIDRLVTVGKVNVNKRAWNEQISRTLVYVGPEKQANIVVVIAEGVQMDFANAVRRSWKGFKKNDLVVFIGVDAAGLVTWTRTMSWSKAAMVNVTIENDLLEMYNGKVPDPVGTMQMVKTNALKHFDRRSMKEFEYLKDQAPLTDVQMTWLMIILIVIQVALTLLQLYFTGGIPFTDLAYESQYKRYNRIVSHETYLAARHRQIQAPYGLRTVSRATANVVKKSIPGRKSRFKP